METCIFCKIAKKETPSYTIYEDSDFLAFLDINPRNKGHTLVIPKLHYRWVWDHPHIDKYYAVIGKIANSLRKTLHTDWIVSLVLGEEVHHAHVWLVPRFPNDGHGGSIDIKLIKKFSKEEMQETVEQIKESLDSV